MSALARLAGFGLSRPDSAIIALVIAIAIHQLSLQRLITAIAIFPFLRLAPHSGAGNGQPVTNRRFVFAFPVLNPYEVITATSAAEARHKLMNSSLAPYYSQAVLLNP